MYILQRLMEESSMVSIDRGSSIEFEPLTLKYDEIQLAREAAIFVMNTMSMEQALRVFTEGLEPVVNGSKHNGGTVMDLEEELDCEFDEVRRFPQLGRETASAPP